MHTGSLHPTAHGDSRRAIVVTLLVLAFLGLLVRSVAIVEPLGIDQGLWASAVRGMSRGQLLYQDVWEQRPPGIYFIYLAGFSLFGWTEASVTILDLLAAFATTAALWAIARALSGPLAGAAAAALYALFTIPAWLFGYRGFLERSVSETFIIASVATAAWCAVRFCARPSAFAAFGIGLFSGMAVILKPNAGLYFPALALWVLIHRPRTGSREQLVSWTVAAGAGAVLVPMLTFGWLALNGLVHEASIAIVDFNRFYVGQGFTLSTYVRDFSGAVFLRAKTDPLWFAGGVATLLAIVDLVRERRLTPLSTLALLWGMASAAVIVVNGARLFNTYFLQAYPPLALIASWLLIENARRSVVRRYAAIAMAVAIAALLVHRDYLPRVYAATADDLAALSGRVDRLRYLEYFGGYDNKRGYSARANTELATYIEAHTRPDERIFLFGINGAGVYFESNRLTAHRFLRVNFFVPSEFPDPRFTLDAVLRDLHASRPRYLIFERLNTVSPRGVEMARIADNLPEDPRVQALLDGYRLETTIEDFTLYRRAD